MGNAFSYEDPVTQSAKVEQMKEKYVHRADEQRELWATTDRAAGRPADYWQGKPTRAHANDSFGLFVNRYTALRLEREGHVKKADTFRVERALRAGDEDGGGAIVSSPSAGSSQ